jgi:Arc/MetJ-type ribon-helix-helix transcriptional regulator
MSKILSVSLPDELDDAVESVASSQGKTKSEFVREALRQQLDFAEFRVLQELGARQAERLGIGPEDIEGIIDELRAGA